MAISGRLPADGDNASPSKRWRPCGAVSIAAVRFQSVVTRDLRDHARLHSDASGLATELRLLGATGCPGTRRFLRGAEATLVTLCNDCVVALRRISLGSS